MAEEKAAAPVEKKVVTKKKVAKGKAPSAKEKKAAKPAVSAVEEKVCLLFWAHFFCC